MASPQIDQSQAAVSRRQVMMGVAGLTFAIALDPSRFSDAAALARDPNGARLTPWVSIAPDGTISIMSPAAEMGQGSMTSLPLILAEELDANWDDVRIVPVPIDEKVYGNPAFGGTLTTAGSTAVTAYYDRLRIFGAQVRRILIENAASRWSVPVEELHTEPSVVVHQRSARRLGYGEIAGFATIPAVAPEIKPEQLKKTSAFRLIGKDVMRVELPGKVNGSAIYSIDLQVPGMIYGAVLESPVDGDAPEQFDEAKITAIAGVIATVRLPSGIGVLAETPWAAFDAKAVVEASITWSRTGKARGFDSGEGIESFAAAARDLAVPVTT